MSLIRPANNDVADADDVNQIIDHLEGVSGDTLAWFLRCATDEGFIIRLSDAAGVEKFVIQDSAGNEVMSVDSDGNLTLSGALPAPDPMLVPLAVTPAQTANGSLVWDSDDFVLTIGDGTARQSFYPGEPAWEHIDTQILATTAASISFQDISTDYKMFRLTYYLVGTAGLDVWLRFNNDSASNYTFDATASAARIDIVTSANITFGSGGAALISKPAATRRATVRALTVSAPTNAAGAPGAEDVAGAWINTANLISRIDLVASTSTFAANSRVTLEGSKVT